ncbi:MAG: pirin family protein [Verrucomicrobiia bacterium]
MPPPNPLNLRRAAERGQTRLDWLQSEHSFSFANYHDPQHRGFRSLRVINQDRVAPGGGFPTHPHRNMEIFSYVIDGVLAHQDSLGHRRELAPGQIQLMSAGSGILHSEFNPSSTQSLHFLQIWIKPQTLDLPPAYTEWQPRPEHADQAKVLVISPDGRDQSATIRQDANIYRLRLQTRQSVTHLLAPDRGAWLQLISGTLMVGGTRLGPGDAVSTENAGNLLIEAEQPSEALLFDLGERS